MKKNVKMGGKERREEKEREEPFSLLIHEIVSFRARKREERFICYGNKMRYIYIYTKNCRDAGIFFSLVLDHPSTFYSMYDNN